MLRREPRLTIIYYNQCSLYKEGTFFWIFRSTPPECCAQGRLSVGILVGLIGRRRLRSEQFGGGSTGPARDVFRARFYSNRRLATGRERAMKETTVEDVAAAVGSKSCKRDAEVAADGMSDTADRRKPTTGFRRRTTAGTGASSPGGRSCTTVAVLSVVAIAYSVAAVDLQHAAAVGQHWLSTLFQSAGDQQVDNTDECIIKNI